VAAARCLEAPEAEAYLVGLAGRLRRNRDVLAEALAAAGIPCMLPGGGYFLMMDTQGMGAGADPAHAAPGTLSGDAFEARRDFRVNLGLTLDVGVTGLPIGGFYSPEHRWRADSMLRLALCKTEREVDEAARRIRAHARGGHGKEEGLGRG